MTESRKGKNESNQNDVSSPETTFAVPAAVTKFGCHRLREALLHGMDIVGGRIVFISEVSLALGVRDAVTLL